LSEGEAQLLERHLEGCSSCLERLGALSAHESSPSKRTGWASDDDPDTVTSLIQRLCQHPALTSLQIGGAGPSTPGNVDTPQDGEKPTYLRGPARLGRYRILRTLGAGGMGDVYLAEDPELGRSVAVKVPRFGGSKEAQAIARQRFTREARAAAAVRHACVCPIYDVGDHDGTPYVVMAFIDGCSLAERLKKVGRFADVRAAVALMAQIAEGLGAVHDGGLVHRDLKPGNVLLDAGGHPFLSDFGLARRDDDADRLTDAGALVGTIAYMAPEQADVRGDSGPVTPAADLYSLGVMLYELLTGRLPFAAESKVSLLYQIVHGAPTPPRQFRPDLDSALEAIVLKAMARDPEDRYADARHLAAALAGYLQARPKDKGGRMKDENPKGSSFILHRSPLKRKVAAAAAVAIALLFGVVLYLTHGDPKEVEPPSPPNGGQRPAIEPPGDAPAAAQALIRDLTNADAAVRLTAARDLANYKHPAAVAALGEALSDKDARVRRAAAHGLRKLEDKSAVPYLMKRLADDVWGKTSRSAQLLLPGSKIEPPPFENWEKGPNQGTRYAALDALKELAPEKVTEALQAAAKSTNLDVQKWANRELSKAAPAPQGKPPKSPRPAEKVIKDHTNTVRAVAFAPGGKLLATAGDDKSIRIWDVASGKRKERIQHEAEVYCLAFSPDGNTLASAGADKAVTFWDVAGGELQRTIADGSAGKIAWLAFAPDGRTLATVGYQQKVAVLWDVDSGKEIASLEGHKDDVNAAAFSPDSMTVATVSDDGAVRLWDAATGKAKGSPLRGHDKSVLCLSFSPDGKRLATGGQDRTIRVWDVETGKATRPALEADGAVVFVAWTLDGRIVSKTYYDAVSLWNPVVNKPAALWPKFGKTLVAVGKQYHAHVALAPDGRVLAFRDCYWKDRVHLLDLAKFIDAPP
jgi:WD40 repeat protein/tRNA A-37 threonylcarbamoyl transferase component Bud32